MFTFFIVDDSLDKITLSLKINDRKHDKCVERNLHSYATHDANQHQSGDVISDGAFWDGPGSIIKAIHGNTLSYYKLKALMLDYTVSSGNIIYERYRSIMQMLGPFRTKHQLADLNK